MAHMQRRYLAEGDAAVVDQDEDDDTDDGSTNESAGTWNNQPTFPDGPGAPIYPPSSYLNAPATPAVIPEDTPDLPVMSGPNLPQAYVPPVKQNMLQKMVQIATHHPGDTPAIPAFNNGIPSVPDAIKNYGKILDQYPQRKAPNWLERVAAGAMGAAAGYSNAAKRAAPIDIQKTTEGILYPGYDGKLAAWQSRVVPAQQAVQLSGEQVAAQRAAELNTANVGLKAAQTQMNLDRGSFYTGTGRDSVEVTPAMQTITGGVLKAGTTVNKTTVDTAMNDAIKANPSNALSQKVQQLKNLFPNKTDEEIWQAVINPTSVGKPAPEVPQSKIKDGQIKADFASSLGRDPATVTDAEMNTARRIFGTGDPLIGASMRAFIAQKHRLPNPAEERQIVSGAVSQRANAKIVPGEDAGNPIPTITSPQAGATKMVDGVPYRFDGSVWRKQAQ